MSVKEMVGEEVKKRRESSEEDTTKKERRVKMPYLLGRSCCSASFVVAVYTSQTLLYWQQEGVTLAEQGQAKAAPCNQQLQDPAAAPAGETPIFELCDQ